MIHIHAASRRAAFNQERYVSLLCVRPPLPLSLAWVRARSCTRFFWYDSSKCRLFGEGEGGTRPQRQSRSIVCTEADPPGARIARLPAQTRETIAPRGCLGSGSLCHTRVDRDVFSLFILFSWVAHTEAVMLEKKQQRKERASFCTDVRVRAVG